MKMNRFLLSEVKSRSIQGVVGVVDGTVSAARWGRDTEGFRNLGLGGIEIRADLLASPAEALACLRDLRPLCPILFTVRHKAEGGRFEGPEEVRVALYRDALAQGADLVDAEWGTEAARILSREGAPLVVSHHDFTGMLSREEMDRLARDMETLACRAIKIVPTARTFQDGIDLLDWLGSRKGASRPPAIAFAMGPEGFPSRILALSRGSLITYASFGQPVAPGQVSVGEMLRLYRPQELSEATAVFAVASNPVGASLAPSLFNPLFRRRGIDAVLMPISVQEIREVIPAVERLKLRGLCVGSPFGAEAYQLADGADPWSRAAGTSDTWIFKTSESGVRTSLALNTAGDGVRWLLKQSSIVADLGGSQERGQSTAAVIAADAQDSASLGAALALRESGISPTIYYQNMDRGTGIVERLGIAVRPINTLETSEPGEHRVLVFSVDLESMEPRSKGRILQMAAEAALHHGALVISRQELCAAQALWQFKAFTGLEPRFEEILDALHEGQEIRKPLDL